MDNGGVRAFVVHELLFAKDFETGTRGESIFAVVEQFFKEKDIPMKTIIACATCGAPALTEKHKGFLCYIKKQYQTMLRYDA